jgi:predicted nucleotidyltransferase
LNSPEAGQVQSVLQLIDEVFGGDVLGAYLHGSAVLGGLRPTSDLDILVALSSGGRPRPNDVRSWKACLMCPAPGLVAALRDRSS